MKENEGNEGNEKERRVKMKNKYRSKKIIIFLISLYTFSKMFKDKQMD